MPRIRSASIRVIHRKIGAVAVAWAGTQSPSLLGYAFRHGVTHLLAAGQAHIAEAIIIDFAYCIARLKAENGQGARPLAQDAAALLNVSPASADFSLWEAFIRERTHILSRG